MKIQPLFEEILLTSKAQNALKKNVCPFCEKEQISGYTLKVGYTKHHYDFRHMFLWINISHSRQELYTRIPICKSCQSKYLMACSRKYLPRRMRNPSNIVLKYKNGYRLGLIYPFETWNLRSASDD